MKQMKLLLMVVVLPLLMLGTAATDSQAGLGLGIHYLNTLGDIKDNEHFDSSSLGYFASYSMGVALIHFEADLEWIPDYAFGESMFQPQAYAFIGSFIYGGVGVGFSNYNGDWLDDPFYALRAGVNIAAFDIFTSYRFQNWDNLEGLASKDLDSLTFGAQFKF